MHYRGRPAGQGSPAEVGSVLSGSQVGRPASGRHQRYSARIAAMGLGPPYASTRPVASCLRGMAGERLHSRRVSRDRRLARQPELRAIRAPSSHEIAVGRLCDPRPGNDRPEPLSGFLCGESRAFQGAGWMPVPPSDPARALPKEKGSGRSRSLGLRRGRRASAPPVPRSPTAGYRLRRRRESVRARCPGRRRRRSVPTCR